MVFTVRPGARLVWRSWDADEFLVFDAVSGDTHLINRVTAEVLGALERSPLGQDEIGREVSRAIGADPAGLEPTLGELLRYLDRVGLVESTP